MFFNLMRRKVICFMLLLYTTISQCVLKMNGLMSQNFSINYIEISKIAIKPCDCN